MFEALITIAITLAVLVVIVPLTVAVLLLRQLMRTPLVRRITGRPPRQNVRSGWGRSTRVVAPAVTPRLGRQWGQLVHDAEVARRRFAAAVATFSDGPLRSALKHASHEVDEALADAHRLAAQGDRTDKAHRQVVAALELQRRRTRRTAGAGGTLEHDLQVTIRAQQDSAERLAAAVRRDLCQLQLVVARLHELTAHTLELTTMTHGQQQLNAATAIADRVSALRIATAEVEHLATA